MKMSPRRFVMIMMMRSLPGRAGEEALGPR